MSEHVTQCLWFIENLNGVQVGWTYSAQATDPHIISLAASQLGAASYQLWLVTAKSLSVHWQIFWGIVNARFTRPKELFRVGLMVIFRSSKSHIFHCQFDFQFAFALDSISCKWYTRLSGCNNPLRLSSLLGATYAAWLYYLHFLSTDSSYSVPRWPSFIPPTLRLLLPLIVSPDAACPCHSSYFRPTITRRSIKEWLWYLKSGHSILPSYPKHDSHPMPVVSRRIWIFEFLPRWHSCVHLILRISHHPTNLL